MFGRNYDVDVDLEDADLSFLALPHPVQCDFGARVAPDLAEVDRALLDEGEAVNSNSSESVANRSSSRVPLIVSFDTSLPSVGE